MKNYISNVIRNYPIVKGLKDSIKLGPEELKENIEVKLYGKSLVYLRKGRTDRSVFESTFLGKYHKSPFHLGKNPVIVDLGCNIGLTLLDFHFDYPEATLIGVEMDRNNYEMAKINTENIERCQVLNAAIWNENGILSYSGADSQSFSALLNSMEVKTATSLTIDSLFLTYDLKIIDYLKVDIEGAEEQVFLNSEISAWAQKVKFMNIEMHNTSNFTYQDLEIKLRAKLVELGFFVFKSAAHWSSIFALNGNNI